MVYTEEKPEAFQWREYWEFASKKDQAVRWKSRKQNHGLFLDDDQEFFLDDSVAFDENDDGNPYMFQDKNIAALFTSYRLNAQKMARESVYLSRQITMKYSDNFSDLQIEQFSSDTLVDFHKHMRNTYIIKNKITQSVKAIFRECIEIALDEDFGPKEAEKTLERSFTKSFDDPIDQKKFERMRTKNISIKLLKDLLSEGTLTINIISLPNTASMSAKVRKFANLDSSRAKQPDMIGNVVNNNKSKYEMMFGEIIGEGKNNSIKKNNLDLIKLGIFMKDALDILIKKTGKNHITRVANNW
ncbi:5147_t:CDS:2 [Scutellospora calospora]|uniref:5147_t:CDS:1 n=1 Tax=Scutellospora calospora TaxID=85575 RepID=A0ACA9KPY4_9GLOM|nr:5147_t:CDS:2 [Scutellospora calospora]